MDVIRTSGPRLFHHHHIAALIASFPAFGAARVHREKAGRAVIAPLVDGDFDLLLRVIRNFHDLSFNIDSYSYGFSDFAPFFEWFLVSTTWYCAAEPLVVPLAL